jgi:hypothetical protein
VVGANYLATEVVFVGKNKVKMRFRLFVIISKRVNE